PGKVTIQDLRAYYNGCASLELDVASLEGRMQFATDCVVASRKHEAEAYYAMTTGVGKLASVRVSVEDAEKLQENLVLSHCCGIGPPLPMDIVRLIMVLKMLSLSHGASGVRAHLVRFLATMLDNKLTPIIPEKGSVGASGDLAPLSHLTAAMLGQGCIKTGNGETIAAAKALLSVGLEPVRLKAKEGVAMINGTQVSTAIALAGLFRAHRALASSIVSGALSTDAAMESTAPFHPEIHLLRGHRGQKDVAMVLRALIQDSEVRASHLLGDPRVQDPYCLRCQPQVLGACLDLLRQAAST
ncbi:aromatic amino acid lyase, partial [Coniella lustricola]